MDAALLWACIISATTESAMTSPTELQSHSTVATPFVLPAMTCTCPPCKLNVTTPPFSLSSASSVASSCVSSIPRNISFRNNLNVSTFPANGTCSRDDTEPTRSGVYVDRSSGDTILEEFCCVTSIPRTDSPSRGGCAIFFSFLSIAASPFSFLSSSSATAGDSASLPMTLADRRRVNMSFTSTSLGGMAMVGLLFSGSLL
mmetsp:Transcript_27855/g.47347  ORF Transcript_27855/g.47347 Transcript_27855/m.47347 type:complete len:201 (+) Transcript_27855:466-1068(+)